MNLLDIAGQICKVVLPIREDVFYGDPHSSTAICTLSSMGLLREIAESDVIRRVAVAGRLLSENKGIDTLIRSINKSPNITTLVLCGKDVAGHRAGHSLLLAHRYGIDENGRIVNSLSPNPFLSVSESEISIFQKQIRIVDRIGITSIQEIQSLI
ncbi:MAG: tetrahydromethanopterin S-methyltransferase subunit A [Candidatus Nitrosotenuis sp.]